MPKYRVGVYVQYDDYVEVEAPNEAEARELAERVAESNVPIMGSVDLRAYEPEVIGDG